MIYSISREIFEDKKNIKQLDKIWLLSEGRHKLYIYDDATIDALMESEWYDGLREIQKEIIYDLIIETFQSTKNEFQILISATSENNSFSLNEAYVFLIQPLLIYTENSLNDRYFLDSIASIFPAGGTIMNHIRENWIKYGMGGGANNIENAIKGEIESLPQKDHRLLRCFVLVDSDKEYGNMPLKPDKIRLLNFLDSYDIKYHVLEKREMENYLPDDIIANINANDDFITTYLKLDEFQKDFIDLEKGFQKNRRALEKDKPEVFNFYKNLNDSQIENLRYGLEDNFKNFKSEFPQLFRNATLEGFINRTKHQNNPNELRSILNKINALL